MYKVNSYSAETTYQLAYRLAQKLKGAEFIALEGGLGAGKTLFVKGLAAGLGSADAVTSPTFTLIHHYEGRLKLTHFDVYRLPTPEAIEELGYEEFFYGPGVTAVEWSDLIRDYLPADYLLVRIKQLPDLESHAGSERREENDERDDRDKHGNRDKGENCKNCKDRGGREGREIELVPYGKTMETLVGGLKKDDSVRD